MYSYMNIYMCTYMIIYIYVCTCMYIYVYIHTYIGAGGRNFRRILQSKNPVRNNLTGERAFLAAVGTELEPPLRCLRRTCVTDAGTERGKGTLQNVASAWMRVIVARCVCCEKTNQQHRIQTVPVCTRALL